MMESLTKAMAGLTIRARVAVALAVADRVLVCLESDAQAFVLAGNAIRDGWRWEEGLDVTSSFLYYTYIEALQNDEIRLKSVTPIPLFTESAKPAPVFANLAVQGALYYTIAAALGIELGNGLQIDLPEDAYEVNEKVLDWIHEQARKTTRLDDSWLDRVVAILRRQHARGDESLGEIVRRDDLLSL